MLSLNPNEEVKEPEERKEGVSVGIFKIDVENLHWMSSMDENVDLCAHGHAKAQIGEEIFEYDAEEDAYHICKEIAPYIGYDCFVPAIAAPQELGGYGTDCTIKLNDGIIDEIIVEFYYNNSLLVGKETK